MADESLSAPRPYRKRTYDRRPWPGRVYHRWTVIARQPSRDRTPKVLCRCECGTERMVNVQFLREGKSKSCGCWNREYPRTNAVKHGYSGTATYNSWVAMRSRCEDPKFIGYENYGGRGISVCLRWATFAAFLEDMGPKPSPGHSIDRIETNGNYEPGNCRWSTKKVQCRNKRNNRVVEFGGVRDCLKAHAERAGIDYHKVHGRLRRGWSLERALSTA